MNTLICVSNEELIAFYLQRQHRQHRQHDARCAVRKCDIYDIAPRLQDFLSAFTDKNGAIHRVTLIETNTLRLLQEP